ncbi:MAG: hypothetical protein RSD96_03660, partial [Bacilli bacterium]
MKKKTLLFTHLTAILIFSILILFAIKNNNKTKIEAPILPITTDIAMLSKPLGATTFTEITSTPTVGSWTIETDCRGMTVTWDDKVHKLKTAVTQTPASCKLKFIEKEIPKPTLRDAILANNTIRTVENDSMFAHVSPADKSEN